MRLSIDLKLTVGRANGTMTKSICVVTATLSGIYAEMAERPNAPVLKTGNREERFGGSNPSLGAIRKL